MARELALTVDEALARIRARNDTVHALVRVRSQIAPARSGGALSGVPFSLKDTWDIAGEPTSGGSYRYRDRVPSASSPVFEVFRDAGAVLVGRSHCSDLTLTPESASWLGGATSHPRDAARTAGGSSGGAAAAVADGMVAFDWGSDIGGSIRGPAAFCGVVGLRLSSETWPLVGFFPDPPDPLRWMNGQGPIASTLSEARALVDVAAPRLRTGTARPFRLRGALIYAPERRAVGQWPRFADEILPLARRALGEARLDHGLPGLLRARDLASAVWASHFAAVLASSGLRVGEGVGAILSALVLRGAFGDRRLHPHAARMLALMALGRVTLFFNRRRALARAAAYRDAVRALWDDGYLLLAPTCTVSPPRHGRSFYHPRTMALTFAGNLADATGLALPLGQFPDGFPRSLQILGPPGSEQVVLDAGERVAAALAETT